MYALGVELKSFEVLSQAEKMAALCRLVEWLADTNAAYLRRRPETPLLYDAGVRYLIEPRGADQWWDIPRVLEARHGDCEDLSAWRIAEYRERFNERAEAFVSSRSFPDAIVYHVQVRRADGSIEDPSRILGMKG